MPRGNGNQRWPHPDIRVLVCERDVDRCVRCGVSCLGLIGWDWSVHHRRPRGMGGTREPAANLPANLLVMCGSGTTGCHGWIESHRDEAIDQGWLVHQGTDPATIPVTYYCASPMPGLGFRALLDNRGGLRMLRDGEHAE